MWRQRWCRCVKSHPYSDLEEFNRTTTGQLLEKGGQMFQVCLSTLITKMCCKRAANEKGCALSKRMISIPKSTHCVNWIRLFSLFLQHLHHHLGRKSWCCNPIEPCMSVRIKYLPVKFILWNSLSLLVPKRSTGWLYVYVLVFDRVSLRVSVSPSVFMYVWKPQGWKLREWHCVCGGGGGGLKPSDLLPESLASQLSLCLWHPFRPFAPSRSLWRPLPRKLKAVFKQKTERETERQGKRDRGIVLERLDHLVQEGGWWRGWGWRREMYFSSFPEVNLSAVHSLCTSSSW